MPEVDGKKFPYTVAGKKAAKKAVAKKSNINAAKKKMDKKK